MSPPRGRAGISTPRARLSRARTAPTLSLVRSSNLADFRRLAQSLDLDPIGLMRRAGIDQRYLDDPDLLLPARHVLELLELAALSSGLDDFGLRLGEARGVPDFGPAILLLREQATLRDALQVLVALMHLHSGAIVMYLHEGTRPMLSSDTLPGDSVYYRQGTEVHIAGLVQVLRWLLGDDWKPLSVGFRHSRPRSRARYERFFRCPVDFLHEFNGVFLRRADLERSLSASSPALRRQIDRYIRSINIASSDAYMHQVTQVIAMALPRGEARADLVADYLGTNRRTLNRRLERAGVNYSGVLERVRRHLAVQYLAGSDRRITDVAELIGFASVSAFTQWFRGSFDRAPRDWRRWQREHPDRLNP